MYVSSPVKAITGIVYLDKRHCLSDWLEEYKEDSNAIARIKEYMETYHYRYAMEIAKFQETSQTLLRKTIHAKSAFNTAFPYGTGRL